MIERSLLWHSRGTDGGEPECLSAGLCLKSAEPAHEISRFVRDVQDLLRPEGGTGDQSSTLHVDVLWIEGEEHESLQIPSPDLRTRASAIVAMAEVAQSATHPRTGDPFASHLSEFPGDAVHSPRPFLAQFAVNTASGETSDSVSVVEHDHRDVLAALAEAMDPAERAGSFAGPMRRVLVTAPFSGGATASVNAQAWLMSVRTAAGGAGLRTRRVVVWDETPTVRRGALLGVFTKRNEAQDTLPFDVAVEQTDGLWRGVLKRPKSRQ